MFQNFAGNNQGEEQRITGAEIGLTRDINTISRVGLDFAYATQVNLDDPEEPDIDRTDLTLSYGYDFTVGDHRRGRLHLPQPHRGPRGRRQPPGLFRDRSRVRDRALRLTRRFTYLRARPSSSRRRSARIRRPGRPRRPFVCGAFGVEGNGG